MTTQQPTVDQRAAPHRDLVRVVAILVAVIAMMLAATAILGVQQPGLLYDIVPDPAHLSGLSY